MAKAVRKPKAEPQPDPAPAAKPAAAVKKAPPPATRQPQDFTAERQRDLPDEPAAQTPAPAPAKADGKEPKGGKNSARTRDRVDAHKGNEVFIEGIFENRPTILARRIKEVRGGRELVFEHWDDQPDEAPATECFKDLSVAWAVTKIRRVEG